MTSTAERPISIAQSIEADQEPRRMRRLRNHLIAEREGAVCPLCRKGLSPLCIERRNYGFDQQDKLVHQDCGRMARPTGWRWTGEYGRGTAGQGRSRPTCAERHGTPTSTNAPAGTPTT